MSWLFSLALVEEFSEVSSLDGEPFAQLNVMPTQQQFWRNDKTMEFSNLSRFGLTLRLLTVGPGEELLTSFLAAFHAKTSALQVRVQASAEKDRASGKSLPGLLAKWDPASCSWKTAQCSLFEESEQSLETWPRSGSMLSGVCYQRPMSEPRTKETESGSWPTPTASDTADRQPGKQIYLTKSGQPKLITETGHLSQMKLSQAVKLWPTPTRSTAHKEVVSSQGYNNLVAFAKMFPTPTATDGKGAPSLEKVKARALESKRGVRLPEHLARQGDIGQLNPTWVEWLMGWPLGWTDLKPLETDKSRFALPRRGSFSMNEQDSEVTA